jgi:hypothetical protein
VGSLRLACSQPRPREKNEARFSSISLIRSLRGRFAAKTGEFSEVKNKRQETHLKNSGLTSNNHIEGAVYDRAVFQSRGLYFAYSKGVSL